MARCQSHRPSWRSESSCFCEGGSGCCKKLHGFYLVSDCSLRHKTVRFEAMKALSHAFLSHLSLCHPDYPQKCTSISLDVVLGGTSSLLLIEPSVFCSVPPLLFTGSFAATALIAVSLRPSSVDAGSVMAKPRRAQHVRLWPGRSADSAGAQRFGVGCTGCMHWASGTELGLFRSDAVQVVREGAMRYPKASCS